VTEDSSGNTDAHTGEAEEQDQRTSRPRNEREEERVNRLPWWLVHGCSVTIRGVVGGGESVEMMSENEEQQNTRRSSGSNHQRPEILSSDPTILLTKPLLRVLLEWRPSGWSSIPNLLIISKFLKI